MLSKDVKNEGTNTPSALIKPKQPMDIFFSPLSSLLPFIFVMNFVIDGHFV